MSDILAETKSKSLKLADGKEYKIPPIDLTTLANIEKTMGFGLGNLQAKLENETATTMRILIYALLNEEQPELTIEEVGHLITLESMQAVSKTISEILVLS